MNEWQSCLQSSPWLSLGLLIINKLKELQHFYWASNCNISLKVTIILPNRSLLHIGGATFSSNFGFAETVSRFKKMLEIQELGLHIETGIETFDSWVLISRLESRRLKVESWYQGRNQDSQIMSLDIKTGIETFVILTLRLVLRLTKQGNPCAQDSYKSHCTYMGGSLTEGSLPHSACWRRCHHCWRWWELWAFKWSWLQPCAKIRPRLVVKIQLFLIQGQNSVKSCYSVF